MGPIIEWLVGKSLFGHVIGEKLARFIATAALVLSIASVLAGLVALYNHHIIGAHEAKIAARAAPATNRAAAERTADTIAVNEHAKELHDAVHSVPDAPTAGPSHALACKRLHDLGRDPAACR